MAALKEMIAVSPPLSVEVLIEEAENDKALTSSCATIMMLPDDKNSTPTAMLLKGCD